LGIGTRGKIGEVQERREWGDIHQRTSSSSWADIEAERVLTNMGIVFTSNGDLSGR
jgi:hypothetical protein